VGSLCQAPVDLAGRLAQESCNLVLSAVSFVMLPWLADLLRCRTAIDAVINDKDFHRAFVGIRLWLLFVLRLGALWMSRLSKVTATKMVVLQKQCLARR
jgi:hypothetical protein